MKEIAGFLDAVGGDLVSKIIKIISPYSTLIHYGLFSEQNISYHSSDVIFKNLTIKGFGIDSWINNQPDIEEIWNKILQEVLDANFTMEVSGKYSLENYQQAIHESRHPKKEKVLFWMLKPSRF